LILVIKLLIIITGLIVFLRLKLSLIVSILLSTVLTVVLLQVNLKEALLASAGILIEAKTLQLLVIILMVLYLSSVLKARRMFDKLITSLNSFISDKRIVAMVGPAILGFLPSPGGALLSAPLVEESTKKLNMKPEFNTFLNFWFRHFWEFVWPVYAGLLLFQTMSGIPLKKIILFQSPFTVLNIVTGLTVAFVYFKKHHIKKELPQKKNHLMETIKDFFGGIWPILLVILLFFVVSLPLYLSLIIVAAILTAVKRLTFGEIISTLFSTFIFKTMLLIAMVMVFQKIISISDVFETLKTWDISVEIVVLFSFFISFIMGFLTGVNTAYIAIAYPILFPLIEHLPNFVYLSLYIYVIGFAGILLSPLHLCLVLTNEYFHSSLYRVYKYMAFPVGMMVAVATVLVILL
jgi:integral membrane protein (TIGR00529 family)